MARGERGRWVALVALAISCDRAAGSDAAPPPAEVENHQTEESLATVRLSKDAARRLAIQTAPVQRRTVSVTRAVAGLVEPVPGGATTLVAPVAGVVVAPPSGPPLPGRKLARGDVVLRLRPLVAAEPDLVATRERDLAAAKARLETAAAKASRRAALVEAGAVSQRLVEEAEAERSIAEADLTEAQSKLARARTRPFAADVSIPLQAGHAGTVLRLSVSPGQTVTAGAPLVDIARVDQVWIRVSIYVGDLETIDRARPASVTRLGGAAAGAARPAAPVDAPTLADPRTATVEIVYAIENPDAAFVPGQKVIVDLPLAATADSLVVPRAALVHDIHGGTWVYEAIEDRRFARRRVEVERVVGDDAVLRRGPAPGAKIAVTGVAELYGTEFEVGK